eukprot:scaffold102069_cov32-Tisochrysis_lutea.AAC.2
MSRWSESLGACARIRTRYCDSGLYTPQPTREPEPSTTSTRSPAAAEPLTALTAPEKTSGLPPLKRRALPPLSTTVGTAPQPHNHPESRRGNKRSHVVADGPTMRLSEKEKREQTLKECATFVFCMCTLGV